VFMRHEHRRQQLFICNRVPVTGLLDREKRTEILTSNQESAQTSAELEQPGVTNMVSSQVFILTSSEYFPSFRKFTGERMSLRMLISGRLNFPLAEQPHF
jgi:hypothetical protein